jgi:SecD/SecF fusion protein
MRRRSLRSSILILLILVLSLVSLGFKNLHIAIPGFPILERGGAGPLGLKLGLDLQGGGHLVYQADTGTRIDVAFNREVRAENINQVLGELGIRGFEVASQSPVSFRIKAAPLDDAALQKLRVALPEKLSSAARPVTIASFQATQIPEPTLDQMEGAVEIINHRVNLFGTEDPIIQRFGDDRIIVQLPGAGGSITQVQFRQPVNRQDLSSALQAAGVPSARVEQEDERSFSIRSSTLNQAKRAELRQVLEKRLGSIDSFQVANGLDQAKALIGQTARLEFKERTCSDVTCQSFTDADLGLSGDDLARAFAAFDAQTGQWVINIAFNSRGTQIFSDLTRRIVGQPTKRIAILVDNQELLAPVAQAWIRDGRSQITGNFTRQEARTLAVQLESGRLPVPLKLVQESDVDALLGAESLQKSLLAGLVGLGLVVAFMIAYYRAAGAVASVALLFYTVIMLTTFKLIPVTLTLAHIGGFVLSIGMAVDANVLIFERIKEEIRTGRSLASVIELGFSRSWLAIRDGHVSTLITCLILLWFGNRLGGGLVTGFALSLLIGVIVNLFTALVVARTLLQLLAWTRLGRQVSLFTPEGLRPAPSASSSGTGWLNIVGKRAWYLLFSGLIIVPGLISMIIPPGWASLNSGLDLGIDFTGGSVLNISFERPVSETEVQERMTALGHPEALVQKIGERTMLIRTKELKQPVDGGPSEQQRIQEDLESSVAPVAPGTVEFATVSPAVAGEIVRNAFYALAVASVGILLYIWYAFRRLPESYRYGVAAIVALAHDLLFVVGVFSILGKAIDMQVNSMFIVGLLTVAGYSVNDTIVVFDRIRENSVRRTGWSLESIVNLSIVETMGRSLNTSFTTLFALLAMLLIGGSSIQVLLLTVALGIAIGTYSSVFIASQALVIWERGEVKKLLVRGRQISAIDGTPLHRSKL